MTGVQTCALPIFKASQISNHGKLAAGKTIRLNSDKIDNSQQGTIEAEQINIKADVLVNQGLIDGEDVNFDITQRLDNINGARLYGDHISIKANEVNNYATSLNSPITPTIASRQSLFLDVNTLNNKNHALILSLGDMQINGQTLNNHSARIEAGNNMQLNVNQINNVNDNIVTEEVLISSQPIVEYSPNGDPRRFKPEEVRIRNSPKKRHTYPVLHSVDGSFGATYEFYSYNYTQNIYETKIKTTEPAEIISGNNLVIQANHINNDNSKILSGNGLFIATATLNNHSLKGQRTIDDIGKKTRHFRKKEKKRFRNEYKKRSQTFDYLNKSVKIGRASCRERV